MRTRAEALSTSVSAHCPSRESSGGHDRNRACSSSLRVVCRCRRPVCAGASTTAVRICSEIDYQIASRSGFRTFTVKTLHGTASFLSRRETARPADRHPEQMVQQITHHFVARRSFCRHRSLAALRNRPAAPAFHWADFATSTPGNVSPSFGGLRRSDPLARAVLTMTFLPSAVLADDRGASALRPSPP